MFNGKHGAGELGGVWEGLKYGPRYRSPQTIFQILQQYIASQCGIEAFNALGWLAGVVCMALGRRCSFDHSELHFFAAFSTTGTAGDRDLNLPPVRRSK